MDVLSPDETRGQYDEPASLGADGVFCAGSGTRPVRMDYIEEFIAQIVEYCDRKGIYLVMDDI